MAEDQIGASATAARAGRRRRGQILVAAVAFIVIVWFVGAYPADRHAENIERRLRAAASAFTFTDLAPPPGPALAKLERRAGFRVWFSAPGGTIELKADSPHWTFWQPRCVIARVYPDNTVRTHVLRTTNCFTAKWPARPSP